ncbi:phosphatidylcholine/phosphatidylserine synthase [Yimella sp. cx-51]|uniref:CDP-alcohol phosphatidyltransferase family protein n=1 Tax=Yimella sp. cx-51 TaxID=2770551 RepID=UPI00165E7FAF|nr:CDP-alcohol phosphatidyltransferase family protein [Yimella sp. cx-51]MBC9957906.1 hypothetical protein [Yimella sp. cx-51]QTH38041.1 hypothetical protein J5M86_14620 [Yimella sp. cx-51]
MPSPLRSWTTTRAWGIHIFTSLGVVCAFLTIVASALGRPREALLWLMVAQIVDGIDGPMARGAKVKEAVPVLSGHVLDLVVDFCTCVFAPVYFAWEFNLLPQPWEIPILCLVLVTSVLWFSREDIETRDLWFRGFPTAWNLVFTLFWVVHLPDWVIVVTSLALCGLTVTPWMKLPHVMGAAQFKAVTVSFSAVGVAAITWLIIDKDTSARPVLLGVIGLWMLYYWGIGLWRSLQGDEIWPDPDADASDASADVAASSAATERG